MDLKGFIVEILFENHQTENSSYLRIPIAGGEPSNDSVGDIIWIGKDGSGYWLEVNENADIDDVEIQNFVKEMSSTRTKVTGQQ